MFEVFRRELSVTRRGEGQYVEGIWVEDAGSEFTIKASVQATDAEILQTLPEGYRTAESYTLFTSTKLQTASINKSNPDIVTIDEGLFQVVRITPWQNLQYPTQHYEVLVVKENIDVN